MLDTLIQSTTELLNQYPNLLPAAIVLIAFVESFAIAGIIVPGVVLLFAVATIAGSGAMALLPALICAFIGAVLGDGISFALGKYFKGDIKKLSIFQRHLEWIDKGEAFFQRHGGKSIILGRFVGPIRPVTPLVAGMMDMSTRRFVLINLLSALAWAPVYMLPGYAVGASMDLGIWHYLLNPPDWAKVVASICLVILAIGAWLKYKKSS